MDKLTHLQSAIVPGGQATYIHTNGALAYTVPHSGAEPNLLSTSTTAYDGDVGGGYFGPGGVSWLACPAGNSTSVWQVFADVPSVAFASTCVGFDALVHEQPQGTTGAWEYI